MECNTISETCTDIDVDDILEEFHGQGHRPKVNVIQLKNILLGFWPGLSVLYLTLVHTNVSCANAADLI